MKKIVSRLLFVAVVAAAVGVGSRAFFSDTETSEGNRFQTGAIDLTVASTAMYNGNNVQASTWTLKDLNPTADKFFDFADLKPGDWGQNEITLRVDNNEAWACFNIFNVYNDDPNLTEPEDEIDDTVGNNMGELASAIKYRLYQGATMIGQGDFSQFLSTYTQKFAMNPGDVVIPQTYTVKWCYGDWTDEDGCDGKNVGNLTQTDLLTADVSFYVEQARHNENFVCPEVSNAPRIEVTQGDWGIETTLSGGMRVKAQAGEGIYLGEGDLGVGANRVDGVINFYNATGTYPFTLAYTAATQTLNLTGPGSSNLSWDTNENPVTCTAWDAMRIFTRDSKNNAGVAFSNVMLGTYSLGDFGAIDVVGTPGYQYWTITGADFTSDWTLTGNLLTNNFNGNESLKVEIGLGCM